MKHTRVTHGLTRMNRRSGPIWKAYKAWQQMKQRCFNPKNERWEHYGGKGITVCDRWLHGEGGLTGFECFLFDAGEPIMPSSGEVLSIDRFPNDDGNYEPGNVRWATYVQQNQHRGEYNKNLTFNGETLCTSEWARRHGLSHSTLSGRIASGWDMESALKTPANKHNRNKGGVVVHP